jgi:SAM-dependent methyltransferase
VDRYFIERFLARNARAIHGRVLEVGDDTYTRRYGGSAVRTSDVLHVSGDSKATIVADLAAAPHLTSDTFDCIICTQTLQLVYDVPMAVATLHRLLRPGGVALVTVPGISQTDDPAWEQSWFWSFTAHAARRLFGTVFGPAATVVTSHGNALTATAFLQGLATQDLTAEELDFVDPAYPFLITIAATRT